jgi:inositol phosphorylceramide mannosyltransferase catalytic subunit
MDISTIRRLDPLLSYPAWSCRTLPTGISNDALGSIPNHPFFKHVVNSLDKYDRDWLVPYITIMYTTGPLFLSVMWKEYLDQAHSQNESIHNLMSDEQHFGNSYGFFNSTDGGSWHGKDVEVILWMGRHWLALTVMGFTMGFCVIGVLWLLVRKLGDRRGGYKRIERIA